MILLFLTSGLFLGWSLGANDASNVFGSAVGSRMLSFRKAALIASVCAIAGAVLQGQGTTETLGKLGAVNALGGSFTVALAAAATVYMMTRFSLPVSTTQAIVGAIIGWNLFTGNRTDTSSLSKIVVTWISGPVIGAVFSIFFYVLLMKIKRQASIHLIRFESYIRIGLIIAGAFGAYSLGANNIANVMGVFIPAFKLQELDLVIISLSSDQQLFLLGGMAIAAGIITYSKKVMATVGSGITELSSEAAMVVVLAQSAVLFIFSSTALSGLLTRLGLPAIPMVPVSSSQVVVGCVLGIGLYRGARSINLKLLGGIAAGWIATPVLSCLASLLGLFFMANIFKINTGSSVAGAQDFQYGSSDISYAIRYFILAAFVAGLLSVIYFYLLERKKKKELRAADEKFWSNIKSKSNLGLPG